MKYKIEPSGCCEVNGCVQVRYCLYLDSEDHGYEKHHVFLPVIPEKGYEGEMDKDGNPINPADYQHWLDGLPTVSQDNPFHNHFVYVQPDVTDAQLQAIGEQITQEAYKYWKKDKTPEVKTPMPKFDKAPSAEKQAIASAKVADLQSKSLIGSVTAETILVK